MGITNLQLAEIFEEYLEQKWGYVYGAQGELYTPELAEKWLNAGRKAPNGYEREEYFLKLCARWFGTYVADCSGSIIAAIRRYVPNFADRTANTMKRQFTEIGKISTIPEIRGLAVWYSGHIGVYVGNGNVIEFRGTKYGCVKTALTSRHWQYWGKLAGVTYIDTIKQITVSLPVLSKDMRLSQVKTMQQLLNANKFNCGEADGIFGSKTETALTAYQTDNGLEADGICGKNTWARLLNN